MSTLVDVNSGGRDFELDLKYATPDNLTGAPIYARQQAYLHPDAAARLLQADRLARALGLTFRIHDAFRPREAHDYLWSICPDPEFVADPARGSPHSRGVAVDLALVDAAGQVLDMGTAFDAFEKASYHGDTSICAEAQRNRFVLLGIMTAAGWDHNPQEWWHYQLPDARKYPLLTDDAASTALFRTELAKSKS